MEHVGNPPVPIIHIGEGDVTEPIISLENVDAKWSGEQAENTLTTVNLKILPNKLTAIIGPVAAGKVIFSFL